MTVESNALFRVMYTIGKIRGITMRDIRIPRRILIFFNPKHYH
jgi:hypothetical protein